MFSTRPELDICPHLHRMQHQWEEDFQLLSALDLQLSLNHSIDVGYQPPLHHHTFVFILTFSKQSSHVVVFERRLPQRLLLFSTAGSLSGNHQCNNRLWRQTTSWIGFSDSLFILWASAWYREDYCFSSSADLTEWFYWHSILIHSFVINISGCYYAIFRFMSCFPLFVCVLQFPYLIHYFAPMEFIGRFI